MVGNSILISLLQRVPVVNRGLQALRGSFIKPRPHVADEPTCAALAGKRCRRQLTTVNHL